MTIPSDKMNSAEAAKNNKSLPEADPEVFDIIGREKDRQKNGIELIASENFTSRAVMEALGSCLTNKYSEGQVGKRYYGGTECIDELESLCQKRALRAYGLDPDDWAVNVQPYSGSPANFEALTALVPPHGRIMGLELASGGHLTHGYSTPKRRISATSVYFESLQYVVDEKTGWIDYEDMKKRARMFRPQLIIAGHSAYPRELDYRQFRETADEVGAYLMVDMAHVSGLVAAGLAASPFNYADIVTSTTHKTLRGPRAGVIFSNKKRIPDIQDKIDFAVFPQLQGGPHNHQIAALAVQLKEVASPMWKSYASSVIEGSKLLATELMRRGYKLVTDGTDNHIVLWDLRPAGLSGAKLERVAETVGISLNKNSVHGDPSPLSPSGVRLGSSAMATRGCGDVEWRKIAEFLHRCVEISKEIQESHGKRLAEFNTGVNLSNPKIKQLHSEVKEFAQKMPMPGV